MTGVQTCALPISQEVATAKVGRPKSTTLPAKKSSKPTSPRANTPSEPGLIKGPCTPSVLSSDQQAKGNQNNNTRARKVATMTVRPTTRTGKARQWDDALKWDLKEAERAEKRFQTIEYEKRMSREAAKQWRRENDPCEQVLIWPCFKQGKHIRVIHRCKSCSLVVITYTIPLYFSFAYLLFLF